MNIKRILQIVITILSLCFSISSFALNYKKDNVDYRINGFMSLFGSESDIDVSGVYQNFEKDDSFSFDIESKLGAQLSAEYKNKAAVTAQFISEAYKDYEIETSWLNGKYKFDSGTSITLGRMRVPIYLLSENRDINYTYPMIRPSSETYFQVLMKRIEGIDIQQSFFYEDWDISLQLTVGKGDEDVWVLVEYDATILGITATNYEYTFRASVAKAKIDSDVFDKVYPSLMAMGVSQNTAEDFLIVKDNPSTFFGLGFMYDANDILIMAEYTQRKVETMFPSTKAWYIFGGYRFGNILPYIQYNKIQSTDADSKTYSYPNPLENYILNAYIKPIANLNQSSASIGLRYDFSENISLTGEIKRIKIHDEYFGILHHAGATEGSIKYSNQYSVSMDIVF